MVDGDRDKRSRGAGGHRSASAANGDKPRSGIRGFGRRNSGKSKKNPPHDIEGPQVVIAIYKLRINLYGESTLTSLVLSFFSGKCRKSVD